VVNQSVSAEELIKKLRSQGRKRGGVALEEGGDGVGEDEADFTMGVNWGRGCWHVLKRNSAASRNSVRFHEVKNANDAVHTNQREYIRTYSVFLSSCLLPANRPRN
jgi:hypothetical protein